MNIETKRTILLVEDQAIIALDEQRVIESFGYEVLLAFNGETALETARSGAKIDLVLMDIDLGRGLSGPETSARILEIRELPIVFLTAHSEREMVEQVRGLTRYGYVIKKSGDFVLRSSIEVAFALFEAHQDMKRGSELLHERNQLLENIMENFPGNVFWKDCDSVYRGCNASEARAAGLSSSAEIVGKTDFDLAWKDYAAAVYRENDRAVIESGASLLHVEELHLLQSGQMVWNDTSKVPLFDHRGRISGVLGVSVDITGHKMAEKALQEMHGLQNAILDSTEDMIWAVEPSTFGLLSFNRSLAERCRKARGLVLRRGLLPRELFDSAGLAGEWEDCYRRAQNETPFVVQRAAFADDEPLDLHFAALRRGDVVFAISVFAKKIVLC